jgi:hypothetical protein
MIVMIGLTILRAKIVKTENRITETEKWIDFKEHLVSTSRIRHAVLLRVDEDEPKARKAWNAILGLDPQSKQVKGLQSALG